MVAKKIVVVAGELSGDNHGASLVESIKKLHPGVSFFGLGGGSLNASGVELIANIVDLAIVGFADVFKSFFYFQKILKKTLAAVDEKKPELAILIDYPGFNLLLAKELKKRGIRVVYFISPQIWAWHFGRIHKIKKYIDLMIVFFHFEESIYKSHGINCAFVGHPIIDIAKKTNKKDALLSAFSVGKPERIISLLPGSRKREVEALLPHMLSAADHLEKFLPGNLFLILKAPHLDKDIYTRHLFGIRGSFKVIEDKYYECLSASDFAFVASGTATLETAILNVPMVILYKVSFVNALLIRALIRVPYVGLVNLVRGKKIIAEFLQSDIKPDLIAKTAADILNNHTALADIKGELSLVRASLGEGGSYDRAARLIVEALG